jgi:hypothetical protein
MTIAAHPAYTQTSRANKDTNNSRQESKQVLHFVYILHRYCHIQNCNALPVVRSASDMLLQLAMLLTADHWSVTFNQ